MIVVILAGGEGTRLRPLTYEIPKALIPVQGKSLTEHVFAIYQKVGVKEVYLSVAYMADKMKEYFGDGSKFGLKIKYLEEPKLMGTAGPLMLMRNQGDIPTQDFFMCNGDNLFAIDLEKMLNFHRSNQAVATIALKKVDDVTSRGVVAMDGDKIVDFVEKPSREEAPSNLISSGYYIFSPQVFDHLDKTKDFIMLEKDIFPKLAQVGKLYGYHEEAQWFDTGTPERYRQVEAEWQGV